MEWVTVEQSAIFGTFAVGAIFGLCGHIVLVDVLALIRSARHRRRRRLSEIAELFRTYQQIRRLRPDAKQSSNSAQTGRRKSPVAHNIYPINPAA